VVEKQAASKYTHETVQTQFVEANGMRYAYRRFGKAGTAPLLFLGYFNSNMDAWDPAVTNSLADAHEVILFDNAGVGASGGETPHTIANMTQQCAAFCRALDLKSIHVVGFSLGGMIAQELALDHPELVRLLILLGTAPRGGESLTFTELSLIQGLKEIGADVVLLAGPNTAAEANRATGGIHVRLAFDGVSGDATGTLLDIVGWDAKIVCYAAPTREPIKVNPLGLVLKHISIHPFFMHYPENLHKIPEKIRSAAEYSLALRCQSRWSFHCHARRRNDGDVRRDAVRAPAHLWVSVGGK